MRSLSGPQRQDALLKIGLLCELRRRNEPEEEIAVRLGFGSVEAMRVQAANWGLPKWLVGEEPEKEPVRDSDPKKRRGRRKAKAVRGPAQELPPSRKAAALFAKTLDGLRRDLELLTYLQTGDRHTSEYVQDGRFIQDTREEAPRWAPDAGGRTRVAGATLAPGNGLTELIAVYLVAGGDPEPLIERLHPEPNKLDREKLRRALYDDKKNSKPGLFTRVLHAARLIRGADNAPGTLNAGEFHVDEMTTRLRILQMRESGRTDQEIIETLSISMGQLKYLAGLKLPDSTP